MQGDHYGLQDDKNGRIYGNRFDCDRYRFHAAGDNKEHGGLFSAAGIERRMAKARPSRRHSPARGHGAGEAGNDTAGTTRGQPLANKFCVAY